MKIRYVVSTMVFWWRENYLSLEQECEFLREMDFGIELWPNIKDQYECRYSRKNWARLQEATENMLVSMRSRNDCPNLKQWTEQIECAKLLNANIITDLRALGIPDNSELNGCSFLEDIVSIAAENNVLLCVETGPLNILMELGDRFASLMYCLDTGYANLDPKNGFKEYVDKLITRVKHLHLTDNYGFRDDHEAPGLKGGISRENWNYLLSALENNDSDVIGSLEMCPCKPDVMIRKASEFIFDELNWPDRPQQMPRYSKIVYRPV